MGATGKNLHSREMGDVGLAEEEVIESLRSKLVPYGLLSSSSFHILPERLFRQSQSRADG
jgi:hypothetical protein